jgi:hypothetical protein
MTKVAISQPTYLPWLGYLKMIQSVDVFVFLDNVQFEKQSWQSRNRIKNNQDQPIWLSVPIKADVLNTRLCDVEISSTKFNWKKKHLNSIQTYLGKTPYLGEVLALLDLSYQQPFRYLADLNIDIITQLCKKLKINTKLVRASSLELTGHKTDLLLTILQQFKADYYLANLGSKAYLDIEADRFAGLNIELAYHQWKPPVYDQRGSEFIDRLAWVDPVAYLGFDAQRLLN